MFWSIIKLRFSRLLAKLLKSFRRFIYCFDIEGLKTAITPLMHAVKEFLAKKNYMSGLFSSRQIRAYRLITVLARLLQRPITLLASTTKQLFVGMSAAIDKSTGSKYIKYLQIAFFGFNGLIILALLGLIV